MSPIRSLILLVPVLMLMHRQAAAQGLIESVQVETYYISDTNDATDTDGANPDALAEGSVTFRVFLDLSPGTKITALFGDTNHVFRIVSTAVLWNNGDRGEAYGWRIPNNRLDDNTVALDTWISFAAASDAHWGVPKASDGDGSIVGGVNNDGGSAGVPGGLLVNDDPAAGIPLTDQDGLESAMVTEPTGWVRVGDAPGDILGDESVDTAFVTTDFLLQAPLGVIGHTSENRVLIAQITTAGDLSFAFNVELMNADGDVFRYVAGGDTLLPGEVEFGQLNYPPECGCTDPNFLEYDPGAGCPDPDACLTPIVFGCLDPNACNFDPSANFNIPELCCFGPDSCNGLDISIVCPSLGLEGTADPDAFGMSLYPNPADDQIVLEVFGRRERDLGWTLYDARGRQVMSGVLPRGVQGPVRMDIGDVAPGLHLLRVDHPGGPLTSTLVVE